MFDGILAFVIILIVIVILIAFFKGIFFINLRDFVKIMLGLFGVIIVVIGINNVFSAVSNVFSPEKRSPDYTFDNVTSLTSQFVGQDELKLEHMYENNVLEVTGWVSNINKKGELIITDNKYGDSSSIPYVCAHGIEKKWLAQYGDVGRRLTIRGVWVNAEGNGITHLKDARIVYYYNIDSE